MRTCPFLFPLAWVWAVVALPAPTDNAHSNRRSLESNSFASDSQLFHNTLPAVIAFSQRPVTRDAIPAATDAQEAGSVLAQGNLTAGNPYVFPVPEAGVDVSIYAVDRTRPVSTEDIDFALTGLEVQLHEKDPSIEMDIPSTSGSTKATVIILPLSQSLTNAQGALLLQALDDVVNKFHITCEFQFSIHMGPRANPRLIGSGVIKTPSGQPGETFTIASPGPGVAATTVPASHVPNTRLAYTFPIAKTDLDVWIIWDTATKNLDSLAMDFSLQAIQKTLHDSPSAVLKHRLEGQSGEVNASIIPIVSSAIITELNYSDANCAMETMQRVIDVRQLYFAIDFWVKRRGKLVAYGSIIGSELPMNGMGSSSVITGAATSASLSMDRIPVATKAAQFAAIVQ